MSHDPLESSWAPRIDEPRRALGLSPLQAAAALSAARDVVEADEQPRGDRTTALLELLSRALGSVADEAAPPRPEQAFPSPVQRRALVDALIVVVCIEGEVRPARRRAVEELARALGVRSPFVDLLLPLERKSRRAVERGIATRSPDVRRLLRRTWDEEGVVGLLRVAWFALGLHRDRALADRFRQLASLPDGTFGRAVHDHFTARSIPFPGEAGGVPERMVHHDLLHVINGYDTDPAGECEIAGFYCGFAEGERFTFILTALATFHLGLRVGPGVVQPARGAFDPARVLAAFLRGRRLSLDVMGRWDYWAWMPLSIEVVRERLGIGAWHREGDVATAALP